MIQHDPRCDQHHTPRQRCNRHTTPAAARIARLATIEPPEPTMLVTPEWDGTAEGVEKAYRPETAAPWRPAQADPARAAALVGLGLAVVAVVAVRAARGRS